MHENLTQQLGIEVGEANKDAMAEKTGKAGCADMIRCSMHRAATGSWSWHGISFVHQLLG